MMPGIISGTATRLKNHLKARRWRLVVWLFREPAGYRHYTAIPVSLAGAVVVCSWGGYL
jgi:hypothetical protein